MSGLAGIIDLILEVAEASGTPVREITLGDAAQTTVIKIPDSDLFATYLQDLEDNPHTRGLAAVHLTEEVCASGPHDDAVRVVELVANPEGAIHWRRSFLPEMKGS